MTSSNPTVVLVHGAFADSSSWNGVVARLLRDGYPVVAVANPYLVPSARGELLARLGRTEEARAELEDAARLCGNARERAVLEGKAAAL